MSHLAIAKRPSNDFIIDRSRFLAGIYSSRNDEYQILRKAFDGNFSRSSSTQRNSAGDQIDAATLEGIFGSDKIKIVYNIVNATVRRYIDSMSAAPRLEATPRGLEEKDMQAANRKSKWLEQLYIANDMEIKIPMAGYYQSLYDRAIWHVVPDPKVEMGIRIDLAIPDNYMPMPAGDDFMRFPFEIYSFRMFDPMTMLIDPSGEDRNVSFNNVIEYWDKNWYIRLKDGKTEIEIQHDFLKSTWLSAHNIPIPHRFRGQSDVDQAIGLNHYLNLLLSDQADIINYAANPITVVRGSDVDPSNLPFAPRAVWALGREGQAQFLQWAGSAPTVEAQILRTIQAIEDTTGASSPTFGREIPSGTSGSAVRSLLGGFNSRIGTKQQLMGSALSQVNSRAMLIAERIYPDREYEVEGESGEKSEGGEIFKPKEFKGFYKNRVIFDPFDKGSRFFQEIEKMNSRLQSRKTTMVNLGIPNAADELKQIRVEAREEADRANAMALGQRGDLNAPGGPAGLLPGPGGIVPPAAGEPGGPPAAIPGLPNPIAGGGPAPLPNPKSPSDTVQARLNALFPNTGKKGRPDEGLVTKTSTEETRVGIGDVMDRLKSIARLSRPSSIVGSLAERGTTETTIQIVAPSSGDRRRIKKALGNLGRRVEFVSGSQVGDGPNIEIRARNFRG